jgi:succinoglycan biosynthesis protein ExoA
MSERRSVLVVIPALNEARTIEGVVKSLSHDVSPDIDLTVVVADGGSTDGTPDVVRLVGAQLPHVHLLHNPRRIQSTAVNLAARVFGLQADVLVRCDAHAQYPAGFVRRLVETMDRMQADAVVVPMDSVGEGCLQRAVAWVSDTPVGSGGSAHRGGRVSGFVDHGHHAAFRMDMFRRAGGYDEGFTHNEDAEFDCRQRQLGARVYLDANIRLQYHPRASFGALWRQYKSYGRGRARTVKRHPHSLRARQLAVPLHLALSLAAVLLAGVAPWLLLWPAMYVAALAAVSIALALKHRSVCALAAGPAAAVMHMAWAVGFFGGLLFVRERRWRPDAAQALWEAHPTAGSPL